MGSAALRFPIVVVALLAACGCRIVVSEHPVWDEKSSKVDECVIGVWRSLEEDSRTANNDRMLILIGKHGANGQLMSLTMVGPSGSKGEPNGLKVESYPMVASSGKRSFLSVDLMPADESGKRSGFYIMEYAFEDQARLLKLRHMDYNAIRDLIGKRDLKGEINEPPVAATKPGAEPEPTEIKGTIELHERSKRLREILLQHPEVFDGDWIRLKRISAEEFDRIGDSSKSRDAEHPEFAQWPVVLPAAFGCLLLGIVCGFWFARKRSSVAGGGNP